MRARSAAGLLAALLLSGIAGGTAMASDRTGPSDDRFLFGQSSSASFSQRVVDTAGRWHVNVDHGETVTFRSRGQAFTWAFNGLDRRAVRISTIAPAGFPGPDVMIYIGPDPTQGA